jgi:Outer membrane protein beta-barrel domain
MKNFLYESTIIFIVIMNLVLMTPENISAQEKAFSGFYGGVEIGRQNIIGGSLVNNIDMLSQDTRTVFSLQIGFRYQFDIGIVVGAEGSLGFMDGNLSLSDPVNQLSITYEDNMQCVYGAIVGFAIGPGKEWLVFGYLSEATRNFDVAIKQGTERFNQKDEQGILRYGIGLEKNIIKHLDLRISAGTSRADFGDQETNITIKNKFEFAIGAVLQL